MSNASNSNGGFVIQRASESRNEFWTGRGWSENETDAQRYAVEPIAGEVTGDESATVTPVAELAIRMRQA